MKPPALCVEIKVTGLRGAGKTYVLNKLAAEIKKIQDETPGRTIRVTLVENYGINKW